jgi:hypothetical protein
VENDPQMFEKRGKGELGLRISDSVKASVDRGLNEIRLAVLGIVVTIGLTVGFGVDSLWWVKLAAGAGSFIVTCALLRIGKTRHWLILRGPSSYSRRVRNASPAGWTLLTVPPADPPRRDRAFFAPPTPRSATSGP